MHPDKSPQKESRGQASLVSKLTFLEVSRRFWLIFSTDILIIVIFVFGLIAYGDMTATSININEEFTGGNYTVTEHSTRPVGAEFGFYFWERFNFAFHAGSRNIWFEKPVTSSNEYFFESLESFRYSVSLPQDTGGKYWLVTFSYPFVIRIFCICFAILLFFEVIGLWADSFKISKSIRRTLRPIYDLTLAAQNMNKSTNPLLKLPAAQELHLSGAIDTLNNITENDLGQRIVISDEREELRGLAQAINAMLDRLDAAYRSQLRFVSDASHELRTPIAVIQGYANLLDRWGKNDQVTLQESIDAIKAEAGGMQDLVEQLLFLARSDNQSIALNVENVDIYGLADEILRETQMIDPSHEFASNLTESLAVLGDAQLLKQAMRIFVDNAIKYTPSGGKITLSSNGDGDYARISVTDNGIGIPADDLSRVFDRFFRADESRTRETGGTGLGLSIAKWIIDRHGGYVDIVSREDIGTKVTVCLPKINSASQTGISNIA